MKNLLSATHNSYIKKHYLKKYTASFIYLFNTILCTYILCFMIHKYYIILKGSPWLILGECKNKAQTVLVIPIWSHVHCLLLKISLTRKYIEQWINSVKAIMSRKKFFNIVWFDSQNLTPTIMLLIYFNKFWQSYNVKAKCVVLKSLYNFEYIREK